ncbi:MAG: lipopolysaccharide biosynthesis protein [Candidatus Cryptobacteroides sp.]
MAEDNKTRGKRIVRNTLMLYFRMFFLLCVGLYTSRVVLAALGETDYGIYNVVGGVVAMFAVLSGALNSAVSRFITFEMGKSDGADLGRVFSTAVIVQLMLSVIIVAAAEPIGLWFIRNKMTIDPARIPAACNVLHFSIFSFVVNLMSMPQTATITAHEKMSAYAWIGMFDGILRLVVALLVVRSGFDRLVFYAALMAGEVLAVRMAYGQYCRKHFPECRAGFVLDGGLLRKMFSFAGWNFIGAASGVLRDQGGNILVNLFSGPAVNAARGVAVQLNGAVQGFVTNFMTAVNPQITKSYASGEMDYMMSLVRKSSRMSYYLLFILALPVIVNADFLLGLWLKEVPEHSALFVRLFLVFTLSESLSYPLVTSMLATGRIRNYQIVVGGIQLLNLPVSYIFLKYGAVPEVTVMVAIILSQICLAARLIMLKGMIGLHVRDFVRRVWINVLLVTAVAIPLPVVCVRMMPEGALSSCVTIVVSVVSAGLSILFVGCGADERREIMSMVPNIFRHD